MKVNHQQEYLKRKCVANSVIIRHLISCILLYWIPLVDFHQIASDSFFNIIEEDTAGVETCLKSINVAR